MKRILCGCGCHYIPTSRVVFWKGKNWDGYCAFYDLLKEKEEEKRVVTKLIESMCCSLCDKPLGRNYKRFGDGFYHLECLHDLGGEA